MLLQRQRQLAAMGARTPRAQTPPDREGTLWMTVCRAALLGTESARKGGARGSPSGARVRVEDAKGANDAAHAQNDRADDPTKLKGAGMPARPAPVDPASATPQDRAYSTPPPPPPLPVYSSSY